MFEILQAQERKLSEKQASGVQAPYYFLQNSIQFNLLSIPPLKLWLSSYLFLKLDCNVLVISVCPTNKQAKIDPPVTH